MEGCELSLLFKVVSQSAVSVTFRDKMHAHVCAHIYNYLQIQLSAILMAIMNESAQQC